MTNPFDSPDPNLYDVEAKGYDLNYMYGIQVVERSFNEPKKKP